MKILKLKTSNLLVLCLTFVFTLTIQGQVGGWQPELQKDAKIALNEMLKATPKLNVFLNKSYGYAVFPRITKGGIGLGAAVGRGIVYKNNSAVGSANLKQVSVGFQLGGQQYSEIIFFENKKSYTNFINGKLKFDAQASAVALKDGVSIDAAYNDGVAVFTKTKGGLMYEASIGGQHFKFKPIK